MNNNYPNIQNKYTYSNNYGISNRIDDNTAFYCFDNVLKLNIGKKITVYQSFCSSNEWRDRKFDGIVEQVGNDFLALSDPNTGKWYLILTQYINYIEFYENINIKNNFYLST